MDPSWIETANQPGTDFPLSNLPYCVFQTAEATPRIGVAIGDQIVDLARLSQAITLPCSEALWATRLNALMAAGEKLNRVLRNELIRLLEDRPGRLRDQPSLAAEVLIDPALCRFQVPFEIGDYTDFFSSVYHATNVGSMFRPDQPLLPNYKFVPIAYHGRASSIVISGTDIRRPQGQRTPAPPDDVPRFGASERLDYELELGVVIGTGNPLGSPIPIAEAPRHIFGICLVNDWSARDLQKWEYQPLGPFLSKSFATSISPFVVTTAALEPFRCPAAPRPADDPQPLLYLNDPQDQAQGGIDLVLEVHLTTTAMRKAELPPFKISQGNFADMYWTINQLVTHQTSNGCNLRPGDLLASGTISGRERTTRGCLLERNWDGAYGDPVSGSQRTPLELPTGEKRDFLEDGDEVILSAHAEHPEAGRIGLGACRGRILPASPV